MNLETKIQKPLWDAIRVNYEEQNYTGAIIDSFYYLTELLRSKSGIEDDGVNLIGKALSGENPKLKLTKLQTDTEKNIHRGLEQILRGLYQAVRNPRSHEKYSDSQTEADTIIGFINFVLKYIEGAKPRFAKSEFLNRIFDKHFVVSERYAELLNQEIPPKERYDLFVLIYEKISEWEIQAISLFFKKFFEGANKQLMQDIASLISNDLITDNSIPKLISLIAGIGKYIWPEISEPARLRSENRIIQSIKSGKVNDNWSMELGSLGAVGIKLFNLFQSKDDLILAISNKAYFANKESARYLSHYIFPTIFFKIDKIPDELDKTIISLFERKEHWVFDVVRKKMEDSIGCSLKLKQVYSDYMVEFAAKIAEDDEIPF